MRTIFKLNPVRDHPASELRASLPDLLEQGYTILPKFTCEHCGERVMVDQPNEFPCFITCPACGKLHDFDKSGGNYVAAIISKRMD